MKVRATPILSWLGRLPRHRPCTGRWSCWYANVGTYLSQERTDRLIEFADRIGAEELAGNELPNGQGLLWLVDEVIVRRCSTKDHPAAYLMAVHRPPRSGPVS